MSNTTAFYEQNAHSLANEYNSVAAEDVHASWKTFWPQQGDSVLDVGAGIGRDASWMAGRGADVIALEPAQAMLDLGKQHTGDSVTWLADQLPSLKKVEDLGLRFDLILVSAVWMHLAPSHRARAFRKLSNLLKANGRLVITLRHGDFSDGRISYPVSVGEIENFAKDSALLVKDVTSSDDSLKRSEVWWQTVVLSLPDDGTGDLNKVRHIIVNDSKSSTYKLALLRVLLRVADAHPGCVMNRSDGQVEIPLGLVALYWVKAYKRLIDFGKLQQNSNTNKGLAFVTEDGWQKITHLSPDDLAVGAVFLKEEATALQKTLQASIKAMKDGPIKFIYTGSSSAPNHEFSTVSPKKRRKVEESICLDSHFFESFGSFILKESLWECFRIYNSWIEPLVVNQWVMQMQRFELNKQNNVSLQTYHDSMLWLEHDHDTSSVRKRISELHNQDQTITSAWSNTKLKTGIHVDHCLPFAYWPNNDKWNLLPTTSKENLNKKDRLPSQQRLLAAQQRITDWWDMAWGQDPSHKQRFFVEASLSLPNVPPECEDFEEVFEAMGLQIRGVKSRLLVAEW
ncbi:class I SAM-dependent methyltransferase [Vibrio sp. SCSIO 43136]|uniref:class I SAM-dependent methyltransferase n=1 Tax=Vibrio sp. SCSIO 43136 TaxID=2819101 RepID=UPI002075C7C5|nr:class I SAM-dependent methyltransferase [Vibrio sp. SCSIO 43136]USD64499.1 methyltransferase domain-containing protein [Vibrio sp. SCSIO 43136]